MGQLNRLGLKLRRGGEFEVFEEDGNIRLTSSYDSGCRSYDHGKTTTGDEFYLSRNIDIYMEKSMYLAPSEIIYLFKSQ